jgi:diaminohydroxyphosphoribosylaminopyrimidine deaminase/5-amino-6-(5-phosphoribosylamino)uracil reductase
MYTAEDYDWMAQALRLAERGMTGTSPNPRVGCLLVKNGKIIGSGWHQRAGEPHAEVFALREAGTSAFHATAYITLEPCAHQGKTAPCADALIDAGVTRVIVAIQDPNPLVSGKGISKLRAAGIQVDCGLMEVEARELNVGFFSRMIRGLPWVRSKIAMSVDGRTALSTGESQWITGESARLDVQHWRARSCAVLTGINTILADNAQLNVRQIETSRQPLRVVLDSQLRIPLDAKILVDSHVLIYTAVKNETKVKLLQQCGATVFQCADQNNQVDLHAVMHDLAKRGINEVFVEAGSTLNGALLRSGHVDELVLYIAPKLLGDCAQGMAALGVLNNLSECIGLKWQDMRQVGLDLRILVRVKNV